ncbi:hypothetical protein B0T11DRAFT_357680 [Plectosphaerella cucumerina]|uniref:Uncharacterized protein n=1 Tax=Plectosphaerella cucumerina TaxID=40658 RepID=A0A8K0T907_9PEZI|nr:hypothetical protein B0T11DRAFT_357680 [Plectosphaerella cucumerina]
MEEKTPPSGRLATAQMESFEQECSEKTPKKPNAHLVLDEANTIKNTCTNGSGVILINEKSEWFDEDMIRRAAAAESILCCDMRPTAAECPLFFINPFSSLPLDVRLIVPNSSQWYHAARIRSTPFLDYAHTSSLAKKQLLAFLTDFREIHDATENYSQDVARRIDEIREIQRNARRQNPEAFLNLVQLAFLLQKDFTTLEITPLVATLEMLTVVELLVKSCISKVNDHSDNPYECQRVHLGDKDNGSGPIEQPELGEPSNRAEGEKGIATSAFLDTPPQRGEEQAPHRAENICVITETAPACAAHILPQINKTGIQATNSWDIMDRLLLSEQDPKDSSKELICVEWRYLPKRLSAAFASEEGAKFLRETPGPGKPAAVCKMNLDSDELVPFLERFLEEPQCEELGNGFPCVYLPSGRRIESGMRFEIPVQKEDADTTFWLLELSWLARKISSLSGAAEAIEFLRGGPDGDWAEASKVGLRESIERAEALIKWVREAEAAQSEDEDSD